MLESRISVKPYECTDFKSLLFCFEYAPYDGDTISTPEVCELGQLTIFYKINRNWGLLFLSAGKLYYSEYIVSHGYNVTGNGERDMHFERMPVMARKYAIGHMRKRYVTCLVEETKPPISSGYLKSGYPDMDVFRDFVNDFESEMTCNRQSKPRRKTCRGFVLYTEMCT